MGPRTALLLVISLAGCGGGAAVTTRIATEPTWSRDDGLVPFRTPLTLPSPAGVLLVWGAPCVRLDDGRASCAVGMHYLRDWLYDTRLFQPGGVVARRPSTGGCQFPNEADRTVIDCGGGLVALDGPVIDVAWPHEIPRITCCVGCAGSTHFCALLEDGRVQCWGDRFVGQLGDGRESQDARLAPATVAGLPRILDVESGPGHVCAIGSDESVWCWGSNREGQLGDGTMTTRTRPVRVGGLEDVVPTALALGSNHSCALLADGAVSCWGAPWAFGESGDDRTAHRLAVPSPIIELLAGDDFTCGRDSEGVVRCGGYAEEGHF